MPVSSWTLLHYLPAQLELILAAAACLASREVFDDAEMRRDTCLTVRQACSALYAANERLSTMRVRDLVRDSSIAAANLSPA